MSTPVDTAALALSAMPEEQPVSTPSPQPVVDRSLVAQLVADARGKGLSIDGENGLLAELTKLVVESALDGEITDHLGYDKHERGASADGNARNGTRSKTVISKAGPVIRDC